MVGCRYSGCKQQFPSNSALEAHVRSFHTSHNPWQCHFPQCKKIFATRRLLRIHINECHDASDDKPVSNSAIGCDFMDTSTPGNSKEEPDSDYLSAESSPPSKEMEEFLENCAYFTGRLRIARSANISEWTEQDVANVYQWATYIQDKLKAEEICNSDAKERLETKGIKYQSMEASEFLLFDSVVGSQALDETLVGHVCNSIMNNFENAKETYNRSCDTLSKAVSSSLRRNAVLAALNDCLKPIVSTAGVKADAGAKVLLESHKRLNSVEDAEKHMMILAQSRGGVELLLREVVLSDDTAISTCAISAVLTACASGGEFDFKRLVSCPPDVIASACVKSFPLFDRYVSYLLSEAKSKSNLTNASSMVECDTDERLRHLLHCGGHVGTLTKALMDQLTTNRKN